MTTESCGSLHSQLEIRRDAPMLYWRLWQWFAVVGTDIRGIREIVGSNEEEVLSPPGDADCLPTIFCG